MSGGGFSKARLGRMHDVMAGYVERGEVPGVVTLLSRRGEVHVDTIGTKAVGTRDPMRRDTIFRIASMTKPITAVATMMLVEECKVRLDEPVDRLLPELAGPRVMRRLDGPVDDTVPAHRPITLRDLLTFRMGFGVIMGPQDAHPIQKAMKEAGIIIGPRSDSPHSPDEWIKHFGGLPLMHQPGEKWMYHTGSDVLGVLIARASGQPLDVFFRERIFEPLGMKDTDFSVPAAKIKRLPAAYELNLKTGALELYDKPAAGSQWTRPPVFPAGGAGLVSTVDDYLTFGRMMLNQGKHGRQRLLSRLSVEAMTTDQLTSEQKAASDFFPGFWDSRGWGFGVCIITRRDDVSAVPGRYGWDGGFGTTWCSDPKEDMVAILMIQRLAFPLTSGIYLDFWTSAYQAIDD
ncbi:MAG TPA: serine hydrolase domain-containing protein [Candidatus Binataceae bacterium]|jgi:CubicO group peptidase (beta-lactamase class C family)|nr:serine hydrolase domain-containing protein [Candidatus Binataceae bacterium]